MVSFVLNPMSTLIIVVTSCFSAIACLPTCSSDALCQHLQFQVCPFEQQYCQDGVGPCLSGGQPRCPTLQTQNTRGKLQESVAQTGSPGCSKQPASTPLNRHENIHICQCVSTCGQQDVHRSGGCLHFGRTRDLHIPT